MHDDGSALLRRILSLFLIKHMTVMIVLLASVAVILLAVFFLVLVISMPFNDLKSYEFSDDVMKSISELREQYGVNYNASSLASDDYGKSFDGITFELNGSTVVYYNQGDAKWGDVVYGERYKSDGTGDKIATHGCGPTALAMVVSSILRKNITPDEVAAWAYESSYWIQDGGSMHAMMRGGAERWGIETYSINPFEEDKTTLKTELQKGNLMIAIMGKGDFTNYGHFIVIRGYKNEKILVADPYNYAKTLQEWDVSVLWEQCKGVNEFGAPIWVFKWKAAPEGDDSSDKKNHNQTK